MHRATGIVIKKQNKGEHDHLITFFTKEYGKIQMISRGVRKRTAKLAGHLVLLNLSKVSFVSGKRQKVLTSAIEIEHFPIMKKSLDKIRAAKRIVSLVEQYTFVEEKDKDTFYLVLGALDYLNRKEMRSLELKFFLRYFEFKFLSVLGYEPQDKTILEVFESKRATLSEQDLDNIALQFSAYFQEIYSSV